MTEERTEASYGESPDEGFSLAEVHDALVYVSSLLARHGIWHSLTFGTLLGAARDGDVIPWDHDFDLFARPSDRHRIVDLTEVAAADGYSFKYVIFPTSVLAVAPAGLEHMNPAALVVCKDDRPIGDIYTPWLFSDGQLRMFDLNNACYWYPRSTFPAWFVEECVVVSLRGRSYLAPREYERLLTHFYGDDWRTPYRCEDRGGAPKEGSTWMGDRARPDLAALTAWCRERGWDQAEYAELPPWPRVIHGAGPPAYTGAQFGPEWTTLEQLALDY